MSTSELTIVIELPPVPASRPRVSKFGTYYAANYKDWKKAALGFFPKDLQPILGALRVDLEIVYKRPKKITRPIPPGDIDNYAKAALDAVNDAGVWGDDRQVTTLLVKKRYAHLEEDPHTRIHIKKETL